MFKTTYDHILRDLAKVSGGVDAVLERDPMLKEWQQVKALVEAESLEAKAQDQALLSGDTMSLGAAALTGSSASAGASVDCDDASLERMAKEHVRAYVKLLQEPGTLDGVELAVSQSGLNNTRGQERRSVFMTMLSADSLGESAGRAPHRRAPADSGILRKLVHGAILGRGGRRVNPAEEGSSVIVPKGDVVALHDGGRPGVQSMFVDIFRPMHKVHQTVMTKLSPVDVKLKKVTLVMNEETVRLIKARVRGAKPYTLVHSVTLASDAELVPDMCAEKQRRWYSGYNIGDAMGFIILETYSKVWQADLQKKRDIYGARMVQAKDGPDDAAGLAAPKQDDTQPVFFHQLPQEYYLEVIHSYNVVGVLDLASGGGSVAQACLTRRIPYVGFCLTEVHVVELEKFLVNWVMDMMCTEGHPLYRKGAGPQPQEDDSKQEDTDKFKDPSPNQKDQKGKEKRMKRAPSSSSSGSSAHQHRSKRKPASKRKTSKAGQKKRSSDESSNGSF